MMPASTVVDLNADLGESYGVYRYGADREMMKIISSANIACGFHAGDPATMQVTVEEAMRHGVRIGAHVGLPDRLGFGRRHMDISPDDAYSYSLYQLGALNGFVRAAGGEIHHFKPHGALYMAACSDRALAEALTRAVVDFDKRMIVYTLPDSEFHRTSTDAGLEVFPEYFADRPYSASEVIMFGWSYEAIGGPDDAAGRVREMLRDPSFSCVRTVCVHSDTHGAPAIADAVRQTISVG